MKRLILLFIAIVPLLANGQSKLTTDIQKNTKYIFVKNDQSLDDNYTMIGRNLVELGFTLSERDKDLGYISTEAFKTNDPIGSGYLQRIFIHVQDSSIRINSQISQLPVGQSITTTIFKDLIFKKKVFGRYGLFEPLVDLANSVKGEVYFSK